MATTDRVGGREIQLKIHSFEVFVTTINSRLFTLYGGATRWIIELVFDKEFGRFIDLYGDRYKTSSLSSSL